MVARLIELWIISIAGAPLLHIQTRLSTNKHSVDPALFSGLITTLEYTSNHALNAIKMHDSKIVIMPKTTPQSSFFIVGRSPIEEREKNIFKTLTKIQKKFHSEFGEIVNSWVGDLSIFNYFKKNIEDKYFQAE